MSIPPDWYLALAVVLFSIGALGVLIRRNVLVMFMCVELMLNAADLTFVTFARASTTSGARCWCSSSWWWRRRKSWSGWEWWWPSSVAGPTPTPTISM